MTGRRKYRERLSPEITRKIFNDRARSDRWRVKTMARVIHPGHGTVVVPCPSKFAAILNAAEVWGCDWTEITDAEVWAAEPGDVPASMPRIFSN